MITALQWAVTIGCFDTTPAVLTLSGFRIAPRRAHLDIAKQVYGYLAKMHHAATQVCTDKPDYSDSPDFDYDWSKTVYGDELKELKPEDEPEPLGKFVAISYYIDAKLMHDVCQWDSSPGEQDTIGLVR